MSNNMKDIKNRTIHKLKRIIYKKNYLEQYKVTEDKTNIKLENQTLI